LVRRSTDNPQNCADEYNPTLVELFLSNCSSGSIKMHLQSVSFCLWFGLEFGHRRTGLRKAPLQDARRAHLRGRGTVLDPRRSAGDCRQPGRHSVDRSREFEPLSGRGVVPLVSAINSGSGQTRANNAIVSLSVGGTTGACCKQSSGSAHLILDVTGILPASAQPAGTVILPTRQDPAYSN